MPWLPCLVSVYFGAGAAGAAAGIGAPGVGGGAPGAPGFTAFLSPVWPWRVRVGANSPSLWPTRFSVAGTRVMLRLLCIVMECLTRSGSMVERRDHVF